MKKKIIQALHLLFTFPAPFSLVASLLAAVKVLIIQKMKTVATKATAIGERAPSYPKKRLTMLRTRK